MNNRSEQTLKLARLQQSIRARKGLVGCGMGFSIALHQSGRVLYTGADRWGQGDVRRFQSVTAIACGQDHVISLFEDGTVRRTGRGGADDDFIRGLSRVRRIACGALHTAALLGNGRVIAGGDNRYGQCDTQEWQSVTDVCCGQRFTAGLTESGRVVIAGGSRVLRYTTRSWTQVAGLFTDFQGKNLYAITASGRLISTAPLSLRIEKWRNLVYVAASGRHVWAVTTTGRLLSTHPSARGMSHESYYVACAAGDAHALALTRDGCIQAVGHDPFGQIETWGFGAAFHSFEEYSADRRASESRLDAAERTYQIRYTEASRYTRHMACGERMTAVITADGRLLSTVSYGARRQWSRIRAASCGNAHLLVLHTDGRVSADGNDVDGCCAVDTWGQVKAIATGKYHSVGLTEAGTVLFCGRNDQGQGNVTDWTAIRYIRTADTYTVGVTYDGTIRLCGRPPFDPALLDGTWQGPLDVVLTDTHMVALYADGRVLTTLPAPGHAGKDTPFVCDTHTWYNVRAIAAGYGFTVGLCYGGTVLATGQNDHGQCVVSPWRHITAIACGDHYTAALSADGRVYVAGKMEDRPLSLADQIHVPTDSWRGVLAIAAGREHLVALTREGHVLAAGSDQDGRCSATAHFVVFRDIRQMYGYGNYRKAAELEASKTADL